MIVFLRCSPSDIIDWEEWIELDDIKQGGKTFPDPTQYSGDVKRDYDEIHKNDIEDTK